jgi:cystathionine beta-lyase
VPALVAHIAAYREGPWLDALRDYLQANMRYVADTLNRLPALCWQPPEATYLAWIDLRPLNIDDRALQQALIAEQKVAIMPGYTYGPEGNGFLRLNVGCPREAGTRCRRTDCRPAQPQLIRRAIYRSSRRRNAR